MGTGYLGAVLIVDEPNKGSLVTFVWYELPLAVKSVQGEAKTSARGMQAYDHGGIGLMQVKDRHLKSHQQL